MTTKTYYFTIDGSDGYAINHNDHAMALHSVVLAPKAYDRATFQVAFDTETKQWGTPERIEEPKATYYANADEYPKARYLLKEITTRWTVSTVYKENERGELLLCDEDETARALELWKSGKL